MEKIIDWNAIQADYENGLSLRSLSAKYGASKSTIHDKATAGQWTRTPFGHRTVPPQTEPPTENAISIAICALQDLAQQVQQPLTLKDHNMLAAALSQYNKVLISKQQSDEQTETPQHGLYIANYDYATQEELESIQHIQDAINARKEEAEQGKIVQIRRTG